MKKLLEVATVVAVLYHNLVQLIQFGTVLFQIQLQEGNK